MSKKRIVLAEDFNASRRIIKNVLERLDCEVLEASDGREALKYFDGDTVDLVITDYNMPNMNGAELVEYLRGIEKYQYIPVLLLSTETNEEKINKVYSAKITAWIKKPFELVEFQKIVKKALS